MNKLSHDPAIALFAEAAQVQAAAQPVRGSFLDELNAARGEVLRFSVLSPQGAPATAARKSPLRAIELRN